MKTFDVETIIDRNDRGPAEMFKTYARAKKYAIKESMKPGVIEVFIDGTDDKDMDYELKEYWSQGVLTSKIS